MCRWLAPVVLAAATVACHSPKPTGPAWPAPSTTADDGGESIDPKATSVATSLEKADDEDKEPAEAAAEEPAPKKPAAAPEAEKPATLSPPIQAADDDDEVIISDEIVIEIED